MKAYSGSGGITPLILNLLDEWLISSTGHTNRGSGLARYTLTMHGTFFFGEVNNYSLLKKKKKDYNLSPYRDSNPGQSSPYVT
jgi:hypothetical protein